MIETGAIVLVILNLILAVIQGRQATRPQREREERDEAYDHDVHENAQAAAAGDAATLTQHFEAERQAGIRRGDLEPAPGELHQRP